MRRFSQRNSLVTLSDINITPLLDLAFVLLIIFIITTPLLEQGLDRKLPSQGLPDAETLKAENIRTVEVTPLGQYMLGREMMSLDEISARLSQEYRSNPKLLVYIRADQEGPYKYVADILYRLEVAGVERVSLRTAPDRK